MNLAEKTFRGLLSGLGIAPEAVVSGLNFVIGETQQIKADRESYKAGVAAFVPIVREFMADTAAHLTEHTERMDRLEIMCREILMRMPPPRISETIEAEPERQLNGAHHE